MLQVLLRWGYSKGLSGPLWETKIPKRSPGFPRAARPPDFRPRATHSYCLGAQHPGGHRTPILEFSLGELSPPLDSCRRDPVSLALAREENRDLLAIRSSTATPRPLHHAVVPPSSTLLRVKEPPLSPPVRSRRRRRPRTPVPSRLLPLRIYNTITLATSSAFEIHQGPIPFWICEFSPFLISYSCLGFVY
jgi:hypothetical protein